MILNGKYNSAKIYADNVNNEIIRSESSAFKLGKISLIISLTASIVAGLFFMGNYIYPEKCEIIFSFILSNPITYCLLGTLMYCGVVLGPLSLLIVIDV